jgi:hypothetical protein
MTRTRSRDGATRKRAPRPGTHTKPQETQGKPAPQKVDNSILQLQRTVGNRAVRKLIQAERGVAESADSHQREADEAAAPASALPEPDVQRQPAGEQTLEQAEAILADCKRDLHYRQVKLALASPKGSLQRRMMTFLVDWRYGFSDYWAKISSMNKRQWEIYQGFGEIKSTMVRYEGRVRARQKDPRWRTDTRAERAVAILKRYRFRFKRNPYSGLWTVWDTWGDVHFQHITNDELLRVSKQMVRWARAKRISPIRQRYECGLKSRNVNDDYQDLKSVKKATTRWIQDLKATRTICLQIIRTFNPATGLFKARNGWELKVLGEVTINKDTRFKHILRSYTKARTRADALVAYIGLQPFQHAKSGSLEGDPKDPGVTEADRRKILHALDF